MSQEVTQERVLSKSNEYFSEVWSEGGESKGSFRDCLKLFADEAITLTNWEKPVNDIEIQIKGEIVTCWVITESISVILKHTNHDVPKYVQDSAVLYYL